MQWEITCIYIHVYGWMLRFNVLWGMSTCDYEAEKSCLLWSFNCRLRMTRAILSSVSKSLSTKVAADAKSGLEAGESETSWRSSSRSVVSIRPSQHQMMPTHQRGQSIFLNPPVPMHTSSSIPLTNKGYGIFSGDFVDWSSWHIKSTVTPCSLLASPTRIVESVYIQVLAVAWASSLPFLLLVCL